MVRAGTLDPESLVARIVAELEASPAAQQLLLRALLTNEFRDVPLRLDRVEADIREMKVDIRRLKSDVAELKSDVAELKSDIAELKSDIVELKSDVAELKGDSLEFKLPQRIRPFLSQKLALRGARIMQSALGPDQGNELSEAVERAADAGVITDAEETRILATDLILRARRKRNRSPVWVAVEASHTIDGYDVDRAHESAGVLRRMFGEDPVAAVMGYAVRADDRRRAEELGVEVFVLERRQSPASSA